VEPQGNIQGQVRAPDENNAPASYKLADSTVWIYPNVEQAPILQAGGRQFTAFKLNNAYVLILIAAAIGPNAGGNHGRGRNVGANQHLNFNNQPTTYRFIQTIAGQQLFTTIGAYKRLVDLLMTESERGGPMGSCDQGNKKYPEG
jgi:hypothetical protein